MVPSDAVQSPETTVVAAPVRAACSTASATAPYRQRYNSIRAV
jgi:hypothetical protein